MWPPAISSAQNSEQCPANSWCSANARWNRQQLRNGPKETAKLLLAHLKHLAFHPISPHMAYLQLGVKNQKSVLKFLKFPRREQMVI